MADEINALATKMSMQIFGSNYVWERSC